MKKETGYPSIDNPQNKGYTFAAQHPITPPLSIYNAFQILNMLYKNNEAIECHDLTANYEKLIDDSVTISRAFKELGVKRGEIISICMPNYYQAVAAFMACNRIGAVATFINANSNNSEICEYINEFDSKIFIDFNKSNDDQKFIKNHTHLNYIITLDEKDTNSLNINNDYRLTKSDYIIKYNTIGSIAEYKNKGFPTNNLKDDALILYTSGSTGKPKAVVLTNENVMSASVYLKNSSHEKEIKWNKSLVCVPFSYPYGFVTSTLVTLLSSKTAILAPNISRETINYYLSKKPNMIFGSPALLELILRNVPDQMDLSSVNTIISGGDFLTPSKAQTVKRFFEKHGSKNLDIGNGSGNAETVSCGTNPTGVENRPETAGKVLTGTKAMIVDPDTMQEKKYGEIGLLCVSGNHVFKEYYNDPEGTKDSKFERDGKIYFKTGTLGSIDRDGYFTLLGRDSRFYINSSLEKIYCDRVQTLITYIDEVYDCAVVQVPDEEMLYKNKAYIVLKKDIEPNDEILQKIIDKMNSPIKTINSKIEQLKKHEIPEYIEFVDELPRKSGTDKVDYAILEEDALKNNTSKMIKKLKK